MAKAGYNVPAGADVALVAATAKSILGVKAHANFGLDLVSFSVAFDQSGTSAPTNEPVVVELCYCTFATNSPGTNSTSVTPVQIYGRAITVGFTAARDWTSGNQPTSITVLDEFMVHPQAGFKEFIPLGQTYDCALSEGFTIRCTAPNAVNARATMRVERC